MTIDISRVTENTALIVLRHTGVKYDVQVGGMICNHPNPEGFVIDLGNFLEYFDSCPYGCSWLDQQPDKQLELGKDLDAILRAETDKWTYQVRFDFTRVKETQEGYFPVVITGKLDGQDFNEKGFIYNGNCD